MMKQDFFLALIIFFVYNTSVASSLCKAPSGRCLQTRESSFYNDLPYLIVERFSVPQFKNLIPVIAEDSIRLTVLTISKADGVVTLIKSKSSAIEFTPDLISSIDSSLNKIVLGKAKKMEDSENYELVLRPQVSFNASAYEVIEVQKCPVGNRRRRASLVREFNINAINVDGGNENSINFLPNELIGKETEGSWLLTPKFCEFTKYKVRKIVSFR